MTEANESAQLLARGLLNIYEPELKKVQKELKELVEKQTSLLHEVRLENDQFTNLKLYEMNAIFYIIQEYRERLITLKQEMASLSIKSSRLKKRALKLHEYKQKKALEDAHFRESQLKREQDLVAKPSTIIK